MIFRARDIMQRNPVTISPDTSLLQAHHLFAEEEIHGAPVADDEGHVVGVISTLDLVRAVQEEHDSATSRPSYFRAELEYSGPDWISGPEDFQDRLEELRVADAMTREIVAVAEDAPVAEVARRMRDQHVHRVLVLEGDELVGIVTTFDLLALFESERPGGQDTHR